MFAHSGDRTGLLLRAAEDNMGGSYDSGAHEETKYSTKRSLPGQGRSLSTDEDSDDEMYSDEDGKKGLNVGMGGSSASLQKWDKADDEMLRSLVETYGTKHWNHISQKLPGRTGKQCR